jgi:protein MpaA
MIPSLAAHKAHDYAHLVSRWRKVARAAGLRLREWFVHDALPLYAVETPAARSRPSVYISAGIHGDEPGGTEGLIAWAETQGPALRNIPCLLVPCLNPWGLKNNMRTDASGRDLNRLFGKPHRPFHRAFRQLLEGREFDTGLLLHEDFDAQGAYIYELQRGEPYWGSELLREVISILPVETRRLIDGRRFNDGVFRRNPRQLTKLPWIPEAIYLFWHHAERTFTIETPSEFALDIRAAAQVRMIEKALALTFSTGELEIKALPGAGR